jgi:hypothetical protein
MRYLMSERTAQFVRGLMQDAQTPESVAAGPAKRTRSDAVVEDSFAHPFELRWAASAGGDSSGAPKGAWIIWLPNGSLVVDGSEVDFSTLTAASGYPAGWYDLTESFGDGEVPEEFDLFLQPGAKAEFGIDKSKLTDPVLVASVKGKMVKGVVESALVFSAGGAPHPWELRRFVKEPETSGGDPVVEWRVWIPSTAITFVYGAVTRKVVFDSGTSGVDEFFNYQVEGGSSSAMWGSGNYAGEVDGDRTSAAVALGLAGVWAAAPVPDGGGSVYLRIFSGDGGASSETVELTNVLPDGKDATVSHPVELTKDGFYIRIAAVDGNGVVTQCVCSMLSLTIIHGGLVQKMITGGNGIKIDETEGRIHISATGGDSSGGSGSPDDGEDSGTGISGTFVFATVPRYDEAVHQLLYTPVSLTFANGRLMAMEAGAETVIAQAVEESA